MPDSTHNQSENEYKTATYIFAIDLTESEAKFNKYRIATYILAFAQYLNFIVFFHKGHSDSAAIGGWMGALSNLYYLEQGRPTPTEAQFTQHEWANVYLEMSLLCSALSSALKAYKNPDVHLQSFLTSSFISIMAIIAVNLLPSLYERRASTGSSTEPVINCLNSTSTLNDIIRNRRPEQRIVELEKVLSTPKIFHEVFCSAYQFNEALRLFPEHKVIMKFNAKLYDAIISDNTDVLRELATELDEAFQNSTITQKSLRLLYLFTQGLLEQKKAGDPIYEPLSRLLSKLHGFILLPEFIFKKRKPLSLGMQCANYLKANGLFANRKSHQLELNFVDDASKLDNICERENSFEQLTNKVVLTKVISTNQWVLIGYYNRKKIDKLSINADSPLGQKLASIESKASLAEAKLSELLNLAIDYFSDSLVNVLPDPFIYMH